MVKGKLITFEGVEGSGKTTQAKNLYRWLKENHVPVRMTREPGGTLLGESIRKMLLNIDNRIDNKSEAFLYLAARAQLVKEIIRPSLLSGENVVCDRFSDSFIAYQGYGRGLNLNLLKEMNEFSCLSITPDITFLLDIPVEKAFSRIDLKDRIEKEDLEFHRRVRKGFLELAEIERERFFILNGESKPEDLFEEVKNVVGERISFPA